MHIEELKLTLALFNAELHQTTTEHGAILPLYMVTANGLKAAPPFDIYIVNDVITCVDTLTNRNVHLDKLFEWLGD